MIAIPTVFVLGAGASMRYLNDFFIGQSEQVKITDSVTVIKQDKYGNSVD